MIRGGHGSGVGYKITQDDGNLCGGYCSYEADDYSQYFWLYDVNDLVAVKNGEMESWEPKPYAYGPIETPFSKNEISGGTFDAESGTLYLAIGYADDQQGEYSNPPIVAAYTFDTDFPLVDPNGTVTPTEGFDTTEGEGGCAATQTMPQLFPLLLLIVGLIGRNRRDASRPMNG